MALLGVDVGGSKTLSVVVDEGGRCLGVGVSGGGNFQTVGIRQARSEIQSSVTAALQSAGLALEDIDGVFLGVAGADREEDFRIVRNMLEPIFTGRRWQFENDASIGLWAGTAEGVGVAVVCGMGTNVIGFNAKGERVQIGGMGHLFGDAAGGHYLGTAAVRAAMRGHQGRSMPTALWDELCRHYGVDHLLDLVDWQYRGDDLRLGHLAPLVFKVAERGDRAAQQILIDVGRELGVSANAAIRHVFCDESGVVHDGAMNDDAINVVGIGSIFQQPTFPLLYDTFVATMRESFPSVRPSILDCEPVLGAVYAAAQLAGITVDEQFQRTLGASFPGRPAQ